MTPEEHARAAVEREWGPDARPYYELWMAPGSPDREIVVREMADAIRAAVAEEREACCRAICWSCAWTPETPGAIRHVEAAHLTADGWQHRYRYAPTEPNYLTGCDAGAIRDRGVPD